MHDEVDVVDEHPPPTLHPLDVFRSHVLLLELVDDVFCDRLDLRIRLTRRQEKAIGSSGEGPEIQGNDIGRSYRSAIYYTSDEQKQVALDTIADVDASGIWPGRVTTDVEPAGPFWEAEPEHQDYLQKQPYGYTCHYVRPDWVLPRREASAR